MRTAIKKLGGDINQINPQVQCDLVVDHSIQVDSFGKKSSLKSNIEMEFKRNKERYQFLKWGQQAFENFAVVPPATGIVHQVNLLKKVRLEIAVNEDFLDKTIDAIVQGAKSGKIGDGKIFVLDLVDCVRIRTGEREASAVG